MWRSSSIGRRAMNDVVCRLSVWSVSRFPRLIAMCAQTRAPRCEAQGSRGLLRAPVSIAAAPEYVDPLYGDSGGRAPQVVEELPLSEVPPDGAEGPLVFHFCATERCDA